jgi:hypothetical protein
MEFNISEIPARVLLAIFTSSSVSIELSSGLVSKMAKNLLLFHYTYVYTVSNSNISIKKQPDYKRHTISINDDVYSRLRQKGKFGESFGRLISRILDQIDDVGAFTT